MIVYFCYNLSAPEGETYPTEGASPFPHDAVVKALLVQRIEQPPSKR